MANIRIGYFFPSDNATLVASSEKTNAPGSELQTERPGEVWQGADASLTNITIDMDMGSAVNIDGFFLDGHNLTANATVDVQADDANDYSSLGVDQSVEENLEVHGHSAFGGTDTVIPKLGYFWSSPQSFQYWRTKITDAANPDNFLEAGILKLFKFVEPTIQISESVQKTPVNPSIVSKVGGFPRTKLRQEYFVYDVNFSEVDRTQFEQWEAIINMVGLGSGVVFALDPETHPTRETIYGVLEALPSYGHVYLDAWDIGGVRFREVRKELS